MKHLTLLLASGVAVMLLVVGMSGNLYSQQGRAVKIGVVDLKQVSERFNKWVKLAAEVEEKGKAVDAELEKREDEVAALQEELKEYKPGSDTHAETELKIFKKRQDQKRFFESKRMELKALAEKHGGELLKNIESAIKEYGRVNGYTLIIKKEEAPVLGREWGELRSYVTRKAVMYYAANIDLTDKIVETLNKKHE